ncbi:phosphoribosyl transferase, partial [Candidatus Woesearchaeota archaeon]|nr:phosphoribosyl transferase [Candidatus Woesearchaeota archaeon]
MNFINYKDLVGNVKSWATKLPRDFDLIIAIPRSGIIPATLLSLYLNVPLTTIDVFTKHDYVISSGKRGNYNEKEIKKVLVVDDSINEGWEINRAREKLKDHSDLDIKYSAVYSCPSSENKIDFFYKIVEHPRCFEWNIMHHCFLQKSCLDIDGVICEDPTGEENDDGEEYRNFILNAKPKFIPTSKVKCFVTSRLEKYRSETEMWLKKYDIDYDELIMLDLPDMKTRQKLNLQGKFKAEVYNEKSDTILFIESSERQAKEIAELTQKPVLCTDNMVL